MHPLLNIAVRAARRAGDIIARSYERLDGVQIQTKAPNDFVSDVDRMAESEIVRIIHKAYPDHGILAEESGSQGNDEIVWIVDPLDGTTNFLHGYPQFAVSIAIAQRGQLMHGVVYDPLRQDLFAASRGGGARLNDRRIRVSQRRGLDGALLGTGFPFRAHHLVDPYMESFKALLLRSADVRRAGSAALDLADVACGRLDGFWEIGLQPWDVAAGALLIREAGGIVTDFQGGGDILKTGNVVAGPPHAAKAILEVVQTHLADYC
jgi:myo-inositol-1(or 4)-monophosphatase